MAFDFPASPAEGQTFAAPGGPTYVFNSPVWRAVGQGQIAIISDTPPPSPANGALWYESDSGVLYIWYNDGNSSQWVQVGGIQAGAPPPPAADNAEYVMCNGAWRLSKQSFDLAGKTLQDMPVPNWGPSKARFGVFTFFAVAALAQLRISVDGTTFPAATGDYFVGGFYINSNAATVNNIANTAVSGFQLAGSQSHASIPATSDCTVMLTRASNAAAFGWRNVGGIGTDTGAVRQGIYYSGYALPASFPGTGPVKTVRWLADAAATSGKLTVEWLP